MRIIDRVEKIFMKIAGLEVNDEDDEKDSHRVVDKYGEKDEDSKVKKGKTSFEQSEDHEQPKRKATSDKSETGYKSAETHERLDHGGKAQFRQSAVCSRHK